MKCRLVFLCYYVLLSFIMGLSVYVGYNNVNADTGFFINSAGGHFFVFVIIICFVLFAVASFSIRRCPMKNPSVNAPLAVISIPLVFVLIGDIIAKYIVSEAIPTGILPLLVVIAEICLAAFLFFYSIKSFIRYRINTVFYVIPLFFWLLKLIVAYMEISTMGLTFENSFYILATAFCLLFCLYFLKYQNRISTKFSHQIFLLLSFLAASSCEAYAVPQLINKILNPQITLHNSVINYLIYALSGVFIIIFIRSFFSMKNLKRRRKKNTSLLIFND